ncbi:hypothetical protein ABPG72_002583 [Tetrahymena utriculariae]
MMKNILWLAQTSKKAQFNKRNLLNKWFQDSVKNYILEQIASPLIAQQLKCSCNLEVKTLINQKIDMSKPKYMSIIDQYFFYINKFNLNGLFIDKLNQIISNPQDITAYQNQYSYNDQKMIRKKFEKTTDQKFTSTQAFQNGLNLSLNHKSQKVKKLESPLIQSIQKNKQLDQHQVKIEESTHINNILSNNKLSIQKQEQPSVISHKNINQSQKKFHRNQKSNIVIKNFISFSDLQNNQNEQKFSDQILNSNQLDSSQIKIEENQQIKKKATDLCKLSKNNINLHKIIIEENQQQSDMKSSYTSLKDLQNIQNQQQSSDQSSFKQSILNQSQIKLEENSEICRSFNCQINNQNQKMYPSTQLYFSHNLKNLQETNQICLNKNCNLNFIDDKQLFDIQNQNIYYYYQRPQIQLNLNLYQLKFEQNNNNNSTNICLDFSKQIDFQSLYATSQQILHNNSINNQSQIKFEEIKTNSKKQEINNKIFEEDEKEDYDNIDNQEIESVYHTQQFSYLQLHCQLQEYVSQ